MIGTNLGGLFLRLNSIKGDNKMGLSPNEKTRVLGGLNRIADLEGRIERIEGMINDFPDVRKAMKDAERAAAQEARRIEAEERKAKERADADEKIRLALEAEAAAIKAMEKAEVLRKEAGIKE